MTDPIAIETMVSKTPAEAWDSYTAPDHITRWNFADPSWCCPSASNDLRVGGEFRSRMEARDGSMGFDFVGTYEEVTPAESLAYRLEDGRRVRTTFAPVEGGTRVTTTFDPEAGNPVEMQRGGWQSILDSYAAHTNGL
ncbi:SRPBCC family protein [Wenxinia saemankumensis]|uniref:Uncharacterized conserved protein YndB, AHSA1/START domain n=1 Tax=Wenxinia saemankumensis TaxID=1447782 RepID=A0A1M6GKX3_9RHOB|nr:SRPBCC family protein [Wenxinia saemankumensis]SHJ10579.1 Uncharacterized conserved protein YndB, AHSA1/START domain [Wenxinia saemankumensis]